MIENRIYISGEEAEWTRQALGLTRPEVSEALGISRQTPHNWAQRPLTLLNQTAAERLVQLCRNHENRDAFRRIEQAAASPDNWSLAVTRRNRARAS